MSKISVMFDKNDVREVVAPDEVYTDHAWRGEYRKLSDRATRWGAIVFYADAKACYCDLVCEVSWKKGAARPYATVGFFDADTFVYARVCKDLPAAFKMADTLLAKLVERMKS